MYGVCPGAWHCRLIRTVPCAHSPRSADPDGGDRRHRDRGAKPHDEGRRPYGAVPNTRARSARSCSWRSPRRPNRPSSSLKQKKESTPTHLNVIWRGARSEQGIKCRSSRPAARPRARVCSESNVHVESQDIVKALELGANDDISKPIDFSIAFARVQNQSRADKPSGH
jgi:hypothetical protein